MLPAGLLQTSLEKKPRTDHSFQLRLSGARGEFPAGLLKSKAPFVLQRGSQQIMLSKGFPALSALPGCVLCSKRGALLQRRQHGAECDQPIGTISSIWLPSGSKEGMVLEQSPALERSLMLERAQQ